MDSRGIMLVSFDEKRQRVIHLIRHDLEIPVGACFVRHSSGLYDDGYILQVIAMRSFHFSREIVLGGQGHIHDAKE